jgi:Kef-type K+ transport system membrane component KefB
MRLPRPSRALFLPVAGAVLLAHGVAWAAAEPHGVDMAPLLLALGLMLLGARLGGSLFERFALPAVLGELSAGILIGNLGLVGVHAFDALRGMPVIDVLAQLGVLFLLFEVGLESDVDTMRQVGASAFLVATLGVVAPMVLGWGVSRLFFPAHNELMHWFVGATLSATSVGITARVLSDLGRATSVEGRIILGAAVIDDVMGLVVLAVVAGIITATDRGGAFQPLDAVIISAKALGFLAVALVAGRAVSRGVFRFGSRLRGEGVLLSFALAFCFAFAWVAARVGLAPIVGAFSAGLILEDAHYAELRAREQRSIHDLMKPLATFLVPLFFVLMGTRVDLGVFGHTGVLGFAAVLTLAAVVGKQACAFGVLEKGADRLAVGLGMIPRGEVGLIFASIGATLHLGGERVVDDAVYSAVVIMVALTTLLTPPLLVARLRRGR